MLQVRPTGPRYPTARFGDVPAVDAVATHDPSTGQVVLFAVNRHPEQRVALTVDLRPFGAGPVVAEGWLLTDDDLGAMNTAHAPNRITLGRSEPARVEAGRLTLTLPRVSWTAVRFSVGSEG